MNEAQLALIREWLQPDGPHWPMKAGTPREVIGDLSDELERLRKVEAAAKEVVEILGRPDLYDAEELDAHVRDLRGYLDD